jgi:hypothetical protein
VVRPPGPHTLLATALTVSLAACALNPVEGRPGQASGTLPPLPATSTTVASAPTPTTPPGPPAFTSTITPIPADVRTRMTGVSWRPGCPVGLDDLRLVTMSYWGFDNQPHTGRMVLHRDQAAAVTGVFNYLYVTRFPIARMQLVDDFAGDDNASMAANNTVGFNCREVDGSPGVYSQHSYGWAVDINPVQNPWIRGNDIRPPAGLAYVDRNQLVPGMIHNGDVAVAIFKSIGWKWGGLFRNAKDYQHFSATGL